MLPIRTSPSAVSSSDSSDTDPDGETFIGAAGESGSKPLSPTIANSSPTYNSCPQLEYVEPPIFISDDEHGGRSEGHLLEIDLHSCLLGRSIYEKEKEAAHRQSCVSEKMPKAIPDPLSVVSCTVKVAPLSSNSVVTFSQSHVSPIDSVVSPVASVLSLSLIHI